MIQLSKSEEQLMQYLWKRNNAFMKDLFSKHVNSLIKNFFNDSTSQFASFFTKETDLTNDELEELRKIIDNQIKENKK